MYVYTIYEAFYAMFCFKQFFGFFSHDHLMTFILFNYSQGASKGKIISKDM